MKKQIKSIFSILLIIGILIFSGCSNENNQIEENQTIKEEENKLKEVTNLEKFEQKCIENKGKYDENLKECLGIEKNTCEKINGYFNECASPCRDDPNTEICVMMCAITCQYQK